MAEGKTDVEIERLFWKTLKHSAPVYGADIEGSLFDEGVPWNLNEQQSILTYGFEKGFSLKGITKSYVYVGAWKSMFPWHTEDMDLYSINYLHLGATKNWYSIDLDSNDKFEEYVRKSFPERSKQCPEYLRHKTTLINPENLLA